MFLSSTLLLNSAAGQSPDRALKIFEQLSKLPPNAEIQVRLLDGTRAMGVVARYDKTELVLVGRPTPVLLTDIRSLKRVHHGVAWNPLTGFAPSLKVALIAAGAILLVGILAAKSTR